MKHININLFSKITYIIIFQLVISCSSPTIKENDNTVKEDTYKYMIYEEASNPNPADPILWESVSEFLNGSFGSTDVRYDKGAPPTLEEKELIPNWFYGVLLIKEN